MRQSVLGFLVLSVIVAACGAWTPPAVVLRNDTGKPLRIEEFSLKSLKYDRAGSSGTLAPGQSFRIPLEVRIGTGGTVTVAYVAEGVRYRGSYSVFTDDSSVVTIEIGHGAWARMGYRDGSEFRAACLIRAARVEEDESAADDPEDERGR